MKLESPVLFVKNIEISEQFYVTLLNQTVKHNFGANIVFDSGLAIWQINSNHVICQNLKTSKLGNSFELYFETDNIELKFELLKQNNVKFLHDIHEEPWGQRNFRFFDPDNNLIEVGEPMPVFVNNLKNNGLNAQQISNKTGINLQTVLQILK